MIGCASTIVGYIAPHLLKQLRGKDKVIEGGIVSVVDLVHIAHPLAVTFVDEYDILTDAEHRVHVVSVDYGGDIVFVSDVAEEFVNHNRCLRVKAGVGFVAEEVFGVKRYCSGDSHTLLHTA